MPQEIAQPPLINARGEIDLHGRAGVTIECGREDADGSPIAVGDHVVFEIAGQFSKPVASDGDPLTALLVITDAECAALPRGERLACIVVDRAADPGVILFEGWVMTHGYTAAPPNG